MEILLENGFVRSDKALKRIFDVVHRDEPSHFEPYDNWLAENQRREPSLKERWIDRMIHSELLFIKLPLMFLWLSAPRDTEWRDADESNPRPRPFSIPVV